MIVREAKKRIGDVEYQQCDWEINQDKTYRSVDPVYAKLFQVENKYLFLNVVEEGLGGRNYLNILYDLETQEIIDLTRKTKEETDTYFYDDKMWFLQFERIKSYYDLKAKQFLDLSTSFHNKSYKWWIIQFEPNFIVESFDSKKIINLGKLEGKENKNFHDTEFETNFGKHFFGTYFETNEVNSYFASIESVFCQQDNEDCIATIRYGKLEENGLENSKTYEVKYRTAGTECGDFPNSTLILKDNLIITTYGCPIVLELTIFDLEQEEFIYRSNSVD